MRESRKIESMKTSRDRFRTWSLIGLVTIFFWQGNVRGETLDGGVRTLAASIAKTLEALGHTSARIQVEGPPTRASSGPSMVRELLGAELKKLGVDTKVTRAPIAVSTRLIPKDSKTAVTVRLKTQLIDSNGEVLQEFQSQDVILNDAGDVGQVLGIPFDRSADAGPGFVSRGLNTPSQNAEGTSHSVIRATRGSPFAIEILIDKTPCVVSLDSGEAFVPLKETDAFSVRLVNDSNFEVAVALSLDGVDSFWFSGKKSYWLVSPRGSIVVPGWQKDGHTASQFKITPFEDSVAAKAGIVGDLGVISATFFRAYGPHEEIPSNELQAESKSIGVGEGSLVENKIQIVDRKLGKPIANVPVRYFKP
ncbi:hypothetical protein SH661x_002332 [Planctomicrobium sp. SH661]|uniref:hypothetical protein n=1 Tax=Planctomicrobium sp. SH661 TaxID=3448124 RepID=UPI003F5C6002